MSVEPSPEVRKAYEYDVRVAVAAKWTATVGMVAILGFIVSLVAVLHG